MIGGHDAENGVKVEKPGWRLVSGCSVAMAFMGAEDVVQVRVNQQMEEGFLLRSCQICGCMWRVNVARPGG